MKIRSKIILSLCFLAVCIGSADVYLVTVQGRLNREIDALIQLNIQETNTASDVAFLIQRTKSNLREMIVERTAKDVNHATYALNEAQSSLATLRHIKETWLDVVQADNRNSQNFTEATKQDAKELLVVQDAIVGLDHFDQLSKAFIEAYALDNMDFVNLHDLFDETLEPQSRDLQVKIEALKVNAHQETTEELITFKYDMKHLEWMILVVPALALVLALLIGTLVAYRISRSLERLTAATTRVANGDYKVEIPATSDDEIGELTTSFNTMTVEILAFKSSLETEKEAALKASRAKSEFLASMSHELRTPLNAVLGFGQMLQLALQTPLTPMQTRHVEGILEGGTHLLELVNELLDLATIEAEQTTLSLEDVLVQDVVKDCLALTKTLALTRNIRMAERLSEQPPLHLRTDIKRFKQVLINLLSNGIKYNRDNGEVIIDGYETDNGFLHLSVTDSGIGIAKIDQQNVFQMFHRLNGDFTVAKEGAGIGLAVTKLLVEQMAGRIGLESEVGVGSTFWIELPLVSNDEVLIWVDALRIGVEAIDQDHLALVKILNQLTHRSVGDDDLPALFEDLINYTVYHFRREEAVMEACAYPNLDKHRQIHHDLATQVSELAVVFQKGQDPEILTHIRRFLREWLFNHIVKSDADIARFVHGKDQAIQKALWELEEGE